MVGWLEKYLDRPWRSAKVSTEMPDGRVVYYPFGTLLAKYGIAKNGYVFPSKHDLLRHRAWIVLWSILWTLLWTILSGAAVFYAYLVDHPTWAFPVYAVWLVSGCVLYWVWQRIALRGLQRSSFIWPPR
jgi:hypothetical protein